MALSSKLKSNDNIVQASFSVGEDQFRLEVAISEILVLANDDETSYSAIEVSYQLEKSSYYRKLLFDAYLKQRRWRLYLKRQLEAWYAEKAQLAESHIIKTKSEQKFSPSNIANLLSNTKIEEEILRHPNYGQEYNKKRQEIDQAQEQEDCLKEFSEIVKDRSYILQSLLRREQQERGLAEHINENYY